MTEASQNYVVSVAITILSLYFILYVIYGRTKNRSLIANYKPGAPGYDQFRRLVRNSKYLALAISVTTISILYAAFKARTVLQSNSPHSLLLVAPIGFIVVMVLLSYFIPYLFGKRR